MASSYRVWGIQNLLQNFLPEVLYAEVKWPEREDEHSRLLPWWRRDCGLFWDTYNPNSCV